MEGRCLIVIEPWICHYEILPTVIYSSQQFFDSISVETLNIYEAQKCLSNYMKENKLIWETLAFENKEGLTRNNTVIWLNTTHIHGNEESYHAMQKKIQKVANCRQCTQLNIVIHNHHDMKWYQQLRGQIESKTRNKIQLIALSEDVFYKYLIDEINASIVKVCILEQEVTQKKITINERIRLCIVGMCREGKKFKNTINFSEFIQQNKVEFVYCGWVPNRSIQDSDYWKQSRRAQLQRYLDLVEELRILEFINL